MNHWFDGLAMLHRFSFAAGAVTYANRFLRSDSYCEAAAKGALARGEFATDPCRTLFQRVAAVFSPQLTDNCNVNVDMFGGEPVALTETTLPVRFDAETLETLGHYAASADVGGMVSIAHPHYDAARACRFSYVVDFGRKSHYRLFAIPDDGSPERVVAEMPVDKPAYMHSFAMTERYLVLTEFPLVVDPLRLMLAVAPFIRNYRWLPERGLRFHVFDKDSGALVASRVADAAFAFHHVNAYEEGSDLLIDVITYDNAGIIDELYLSHLRAGETVNATGRLTRCIVPIDGAEPIEVVPLADEMIELPRIDYDRCAGRPYRFVWGTGRHARWRLSRQHRAHRRRQPCGRASGMPRAAIPASRCSSPTPAPTRKARACCCRWFSMRGAARRSCWCSTHIRLPKLPVPSARTTSPSASTATIFATA